jgi:Tetratricopeptide repeat
VTRPGEPPPPVTGEVLELEIDAMDLAEWEQGQRTPQASVANLAALVQQSVKPPEPIAPPGPRKTAVVARPRATGPVARASDLAAARPARRARADKVTPVVAVPVPIAHDIPTTPVVRIPSGRDTSTAAAALAAAPAVAPAAPTAASTRAVAPRAQPVAPRAQLVAPRAQSVAPRAQPVAPRAQPVAPRAQPVAPRAQPVAPRAQPVAPRARRDSSAEMDPDATPSSSRPLSAIRAGVARPGSAMDDVRSATLSDPAAQTGPQAVLGDLGPRTPLRTVPGASHAEPIALPLPAPVEAASQWGPLANPDPAEPAPQWGPLANPDPAEPAPQWSPLVDPDPAEPPPRVHRDRDTDGLRGLLPAASRRRLLWIGGAAGVVIVAVVMLASGRRADGVAPAAALSEDHAQRRAVADRAAPTTPVPGAAAGTAPAKMSASPAGALPASAPVPDPVPAAAPGVAASHPSRGAAPKLGGPKLGGKKLVVEYGSPASEPALPGLTAQTAEDPAIGRARSAYLSGNRQLFAGDAQAAIRAYRQALSMYPGYVGGYRGLGLAYAQLGDREKALDAFKTYVTTVPGAKDVELIKKRIARLTGM